MTAVVEEKQKGANVNDILSTINKDVEFSQTNDKYDILIEYNPNSCSLSLTLTQTHPSSTIYTQLFSKQNIKTITKKCELRTKDLYELLSVQLSSKKSINKLFRIYTHSNLQIMIERYNDLNKIRNIPESDIMAQPPPANISMINSSSSDECEIDFDVDGIIKDIKDINDINDINGINSTSFELPLGWAKLKDNDGFYYFNVITSEKQRNRPSIHQLYTTNNNQQQQYMLLLYHFSPSKYVKCNYCFILKNTEYNHQSKAILPPFTSLYSSKKKNMDLLKIIHSIENMPIPRCKFEDVNGYNEAMVSSMITEFPHTFRELLYLTQRRHLSTMDSGHDPRKNSRQKSNHLSALDIFNNDPYAGMSARSRRIAIIKDEQQRKETVPPPSDLELNILNEPLPNKIMPSSNLGIDTILKKKKKLKFQLNYNDIDIDTDSYKHIDYSMSALIYNSEHNIDTVLYRILQQTDILNHDILLDINGISTLNHFPLILKIISNLPFGTEHHKQNLLAMLLENVSNKKSSYTLQQKLLFYYWSYAKHNNKGLNYIDTHLYLCNDYGLMSLYGLSAIIDKQNGLKAMEKEEKDSNDKSVFVVESTKCFKRIIGNITTHSFKNEIKFDNYDSMIFDANIPSEIVLPSINMNNMEYNEMISSFYIDGIMYNNIFQYKNCNVYDIFCSVYHSNREKKKNLKKFQSTCLLRVGIQTKSSQNMRYIFDLINCIWSEYKYKYQFEYNRSSIKGPNDNDEDENKMDDDVDVDGITVNIDDLNQAKNNNKMEVTLNNIVLYLECECITKYIGIWKIKGNLLHFASTSSLYQVLQQRMKYFHDIRSFAQHFIVSSSTIFVSSYIMGLDWNEILETCFIHDQYGDVYQLSPLSILFNTKNYNKSFNEMLNNIINDNDDEKDEKDEKNVFVLHIYKLLSSLQNIYQKCMDNKQYENLWNIWIIQVKRLLNIIIFNIDTSDINELNKKWFDHSNLYQILNIAKLMYCSNCNDDTIIRNDGMTQHFANIIRVETQYYTNNIGIGK